MKFLKKIKVLITGPETAPPEQKREKREDSRDGKKEQRSAGGTRRDSRSAGRGDRRSRKPDSQRSRQADKQSRDSESSQQGDSGKDKQSGGDGSGRPSGSRRRGKRGGRRRPRGGRRKQQARPDSKQDQKEAGRQQDQEPGQQKQQDSGAQRGESGGDSRGKQDGRDRKPSGKPRGSRRGRRGGKRDRGSKRRRKDLGGSSQRIEFPELLEVDKSSPEFTENEFRPLGLSEKIVLALAANRFREPTDIQREVIPAALEGADLLGQAKTGTGKTVAFLMPIFDRMRHDSDKVQALIVVPTRELCRQVSWEARRFGRTLEYRVMSVYGGTSVNKEIEEFRQKPQIVVGTPGRLLDHIGRGNLDLSGLSTLVLDEADRMFDIGFRKDIYRIIEACPDKRQIMLLSATLDDQVEDLSRRYMNEPRKIYLSRDEVSVESIWQRYINVERRNKTETLVRLLENQKPTQSIIFTNTKKMSDAVALRLAKKNFKARCIHSDLSQNKRERIMDDFRTGKIEHLVATDVAARGLDITGISHVINYDIPDNAEDYVHRVGRTGRMGSAGKAFTFVTAEEGGQLTEVEKFIDKMMEEWEVGQGGDGDGDGGGEGKSSGG